MTRPTTGSMWRATIDIVRRHFAIFATIAAAAAFLPALATRLLFPELANVQLPVPGQAPPALPAGYFLFLPLAYLVQMTGMFTIAAITADPAEGGGRRLGETVAAALPAIGKSFLAALLFMLAYFAVLLVAGIALIVMGTLLALLAGGADAAKGPAAGAMGGAMAAALIAAVVPVLIWLSARLSPLAGVYLQEPVGVVAGIKRAWALSRGSAWTIVRLVLILFAVIAVLVAAQFGIAATGAVSGGVAALLLSLALAAIGAWLFIYQAAAIGIIYRQLRAAEAAW